MTEEYELSTYNRHELNYDQTALGRLPISIMEDFTIESIFNLTSLPKGKIEGHVNSRNVTQFIN